MIRKLIVPLALTSGVLLTAPAAEARDGCGLGFHRGYYGWCRPNLAYRPYAFAPAYPRFGYRGWGGGYRWHYAYRYRYRYQWHRHFAWHGGGHRWGGFRHAGWHHRW